MVNPITVSMDPGMTAAEEALVWQEFKSAVNLDTGSSLADLAAETRAVRYWDTVFALLDSSADADAVAYGLR